MKKQIATLALAAVSMVTMGAFAQNKDCKAQCKDKQAKCVNADRKDCKKMRPGCFNPFEGLNLTDAQKEKLGKVTCPAQQARADRQKAKADDKAKREERRAKAKEARANYLKEVKSILTPEQYTQFLENFFLNSRPANGGKAFRKGHHGKHHGAKGFRNGKDFNKADRKAQDNK